MKFKQFSQQRADIKRNHRQEKTFYKKRLYLLLFCFLFLISCAGVSPSSPPIGIKLSHLLPSSLIKKIRSFRVMAFDESIYRCNKTNEVIYNRSHVVGFQAMVTFDWDYASSISNRLPHVHLNLPSSTNTTWAIMVEAYDKKRSLQTTTNRLGYGCEGKISISQSRTPTIIIKMTANKNP